MKKSVASILSNTKTRTLALLTGSVLTVGIIVAIVSSGKTGEPLESKQSKTSAVPPGIQSTPGAKTSERYRELQQQANLKGSKEAEKSDATFVPTIVSSAPEKTENKNEDLQNELLKALDASGKAIEKAKPPQANQSNQQLDAILHQQKLDEENERKLRQQRMAEAEAEKMAALNEQRLRAVEQVAQAMEQQTQAAFNAWNSVSAQQYVSGSWNEDKDKNKNAATQTDGRNTKDTRPVVMKAGSIMFAVLETSVNSDEPGPILARVVQGKLKDAKLIGTIDVGNNSEKITLKFDTLNIPSAPNSSKISAVAIDPDNARTALASDIDNHYILRWGSLFASAFLEGYSKAVSESGTTVTQSSSAGASTTTTNKQSLSGKQQLYEGLGKVGERWSDQLGTNFARKPTITIDSGVSIGVLITADLKLGDDPTKNNANQGQGTNNAGDGQNNTNNGNLQTGGQSGQNTNMRNEPQNLTTPTANQVGAGGQNTQNNPANNTNPNSTPLNSNNPFTNGLLNSNNNGNT